METYLFLINALGFLLMLLDKIFAKVHCRRIPESVLMCIAAAGGSLGSALAMWLVRHKTRHPRFSIGLPLLLILHLAVLIFLRQLAV